MDNFFLSLRQIFLNIEKILVKISEEQAYMRCLIVFLHIFEIEVSNFYWPVTWEIWQSKIPIKFISTFWSNDITPYKSFSIFHPLFTIWVQSGKFICLFIELNLKIRFNFLARLCFYVIWLVKCLKIRKLKIKIMSI